MASAVVVTAGGASANSYCSRTVADTYHDDRLHASTWAAASDDTKDAALLMATRVLDQQFAWAGVRSAPGTQRLEWPRDGLLNDEGDLALDRSTIPTRLQDATARICPAAHRLRYHSGLRHGGRGDHVSQSRVCEDRICVRRGGAHRPNPGCCPIQPAASLVGVHSLSPAVYLAAGADVRYGTR